MWKNFSRKLLAWQVVTARTKSKIATRTTIMIGYSDNWLMSDGIILIIYSLLLYWYSPNKSLEIKALMTHQFIFKPASRNMVLQQSISIWHRFILPLPSSSFSPRPLPPCSDQKTYLAKVAYKAQKLGVDTFPEPVGPGGLFGFCRRCGVAGGMALQAVSKCPLCR